MPYIKTQMLFVGSNGEKILSSCFNNQYNLSCINSDKICGIASLQLLGRGRKIATNAEGHFIEVKYAVRLDFYMNDVLLSDEFLEVPGLSEEVIIGAATMQKWRIKLDFEHNKATVDPKVAKMQLI